MRQKRFCGNCGKSKMIPKDMTHWKCDDCGEWNVKEVKQS